MKLHTDPLVIQNHNVVLILNDLFAKNPKIKIDKDDFMRIQKIVWDKVKKELNIKFNGGKKDV